MWCSRCQLNNYQHGNHIDKHSNLKTGLLKKFLNRIYEQ